MAFFSWSCLLCIHENLGLRIFTIGIFETSSACYKIKTPMNPSGLCLVSRSWVKRVLVRYLLFWVKHRYCLWQ